MKKVLYKNVSIRKSVIGWHVYKVAKLADDYKRMPENSS